MKNQQISDVSERGRHANYSQEYIRAALELWRASGRSATAVVAQLGIRRATEVKPPSPARPARSVGELEAEIRRLSALQMAITRRRPTTRVIVHSDRGTQYASGIYCKTLAAHGLIPSMNRSGNCYDNAYIESFWSSLKYELIYRQRFGSRAEARRAIFDYIESFYNQRRLHSSLGYQSPLDFESQLN